MTSGQCEPRLWQILATFLVLRIDFRVKVTIPLLQLALLLLSDLFPTFPKKNVEPNAARINHNKDIYALKLV